MTLALIFYLFIKMLTRSATFSISHCNTAMLYGFGPTITGD